MCLHSKIRVRQNFEKLCWALISIKSYFLKNNLLAYFLRNRLSRSAIFRNYKTLFCGRSLECINSTCIFIFFIDKQHYFKQKIVLRCASNHISFFYKANFDFIFKINLVLNLTFIKTIWYIISVWECRQPKAFTVKSITK